MVMKLSPTAFLAYKPPGRPEGDVERLSSRPADSTFTADEQIPVFAALAREVVESDVDLRVALEQLRVAFGNLPPAGADPTNGVVPGSEPASQTASRPVRSPC